MKKDYNFMKPYKVKKKGLFGGVCIDFEGDEIFVSTNEVLSKRITAMLNGAYNMGRYHELLNKEK